MRDLNQFSFIDEGNFELNAGNLLPLTKKTTFGPKRKNTLGQQSRAAKTFSKRDGGSPNESSDFIDSSDMDSTPRRIEGTPEVSELVGLKSDSLQ